MQFQKKEKLEVIIGVLNNKFNDYPFMGVGSKWIRNGEHLDKDEDIV